MLREHETNATVKVCQATSAQIAESNKTTTEQMRIESRAITL